MKPSQCAFSAYLALRYYAHNDSKNCERISIKTLAGIVNVSEATLKRGLAELVKLGVLEIRRRTKKTSSGRRMPLPNLYILLHIELGDDKI